MFQTISQDLRFALRGLRTNPAFTLVAVGSLALAIGANTSIFSFVDAILLRKLPVPEPERLVRIAEFEKGKETSSVFSYPFVEELDKRSQFFSGVFGSFPVRVYLTGQGGNSEPLDGEVVTGGFFRTLGVKPALGRLLTDADVAAASGNPVCVLSYAAWQERFAGDAHIVGRKLLLNNRPYQVIGVTQRGFNGDKLQPRIDMQVPVSRMGDFMGGFFSEVAQGRITWRSPGFAWLEPVARLRPGANLARAQDMLESLAHGIKTNLALPANRAFEARHSTQFRLFDASQGANSDQTRRDPLLVLMGIVGVILLIACLNVANLLLARAKRREKEFALRLSLGAGRLRLTRQLLVESLAIAMAGGALGLLLSLWLTQILLYYFNGTQTGGRGLQIHLDPLVLAFTAGLSLLTAMLFGLAPAWQSAKVEILPNLKSAEAGHSAARDRATLRKLLTTGQLALSLCLLFAAGLLVQTLRHLQTVDLGFSPAHVVTLAIDPAMIGARGQAIDHTLDEIVSRLKADPQVAQASYAVVSPLEGSAITLDVNVPGHIRRDSDPSIAFNMVSPDYFQTLGQRLLAGRDFSAHDARKAPHVAIVNPLFAQEYFPKVNPIGRHFKQDDTDTEIVGLAANALYRSVRETAGPLVYLPAAQTQSSGYTLLVRGRPGAQGLVPEVERVIRNYDRKLPIYDVHTLEAQIENGISSERILSFLSSLFSGLAALLCAMGLYGIVAYGVTSRTREIGIRFALGATRGGVSKLFLSEAALLLCGGVALGVPAALASGFLLKSLLFGLQANNPVTLVFVCFLLLLCGLLATLIPVRRAIRIEPSAALRHE